MERVSWQSAPAAAWSQFTWDYKYRQNLLNWLMELSPNSTSTILDVGCLQGQYIKKMRSVGYLGKYKGLDINEHFLDKAKEMNPDETFEPQNINELKEANASYDLVVSSHVIDHLYVLDRPMSELFRVARRYVILGIMVSAGDTRINHDHDFINHEWSLAQIFANTASGFTPIRTAMFNPEWDTKVSILQCVWKRQ